MKVELSDEVRDAVDTRGPVVALESTIFSPTPMHSIDV